MGRPDILAAGRDLLSPVERFQIAAIRRSFEPGAVDKVIRLCQRHIGSNWITYFTGRLRHVHGLERIPSLDLAQSYICVCNHRSFFDLYVVTGHLVKAGLLPHRMVFPVRSEFFYDQPLGLFVNGVMSFFAMYPPMFRDRRRAMLNLVSLEESAWLLRRGGAFLGLHPEGTRNKGDDPYSLLPAQSGAGRLIYQAKVPVIPVFINGLINDLVRQVASNFDGTGTPVHMVFGAPVDFGDLLERPGSPRLYRQVAERALDAICVLGQEEKRYRSITATGSPTDRADDGRVRKAGGDAR